MWPDWFNTTIGDQVRLQRGIDITKAEQRSGSVPVVSSGGIFSFHDTAFAKAPGVVLGRKGNVGTVFYLSQDYWPHDTSLWVTDFRGNNPRFVYYFFLNISDELKSMDVGSANPALNRNHVHPLLVNWPQRDEQNAIARVLGALDDKIELNRRLNRTLEDLASCLFRSWFVDFEPAVAKAAGRKPAHLCSEIAALFPDGFQDSELGLVPKGWRVFNVESLIQRLSVGKKFDQKTALPTGRVPILDQGQSGVIGYHNEEPGICASAQDPVVVFANHTCYTRLITYPFSAIQNVLPFKGKDISTTWLFYATDGLQEFVEYKGHWPDLMIKKIVVPSRDLSDEFENIVRPWVAMARHNDSESRTLATLRDTILPKLLSGEIRVRDCEKLVQGRS